MPKQKAIPVKTLDPMPFGLSAWEWLERLIRVAQNGSDVKIVKTWTVPKSIGRLK